MKNITVILTLLLSSFVLFYYFSKNNSKKTEPFSANTTTLVVGTNAEYPPFAYIKNDTIIGFDIDLIKEIAQRLDKKIEIKDMPFDVLIPEIQRGSVDLIAAGMTPSPEREKEVIFTKCYFTGDPLVIVSPKEEPLRTIDDLTDKKIVVNEGYTADYYMTDIKGPELVRLPAPAAAFLALESKRVDAYVAARSTIASFFEQDTSDKYVTTEIPKTEEKYALAVSPHAAELTPKINQLIDEIKKDGTFDKLKKKWNIE